MKKHFGLMVKVFTPFASTALQLHMDQMTSHDVIESGGE